MTTEDATAPPDDSVGRLTQEEEELLPKWGDPRVQTVYDLLCDDVVPRNRAEHWEGFLARRIVAALSAAPAPVEVDGEAMSERK
jgi:hypothetical protein